MARRVDPAAVFGDVSEDAHGLDDGFGGDWDALDLLKDVRERKAEIFAAALEELESVGVAVDGALGELVALGEGARAAPSQEFLFDLVALRVLADGALSSVP